MLVCHVNSKIPLSGCLPACHVADVHNIAACAYVCSTKARMQVVRYTMHLTYTMPFTYPLIRHDMLLLLLLLLLIMITVILLLIMFIICLTIQMMITTPWPAEVARPPQATTSGPQQCMFLCFMFYTKTYVYISLSLYIYIYIYICIL